MKQSMHCYLIIVKLDKKDRICKKNEKDIYIRRTTQNYFHSLLDGLVADPSVFPVDRSYPPQPKQYTMNYEPQTTGNRESYYYSGKTPRISIEA